MEYRSELERLMTLDAATIDRVCRGESIPGELTHCLDEHLELSELADDAETAGRPEQAAYYRQEAAAWRATSLVLRRLAVAAGHAERAGRVA